MDEINLISSEVVELLDSSPIKPVSEASSSDLEAIDLVSDEVAFSDDVEQTGPKLGGLEPSVANYGMLSSSPIYFEQSGGAGQSIPDLNLDKNELVDSSVNIDNRGFKEVESEIFRVNKVISESSDLFVPSSPPQTADLLPEQAPEPVAEPVAKPVGRPRGRPKKATAESTIEIPQASPLASTIADSIGPKKGSTLKTRKTAGNCITVNLYAFTDLKPLLIKEFEKLDVSPTLLDANDRPPSGVHAVVTAYGVFDDFWDTEINSFVKTNSVIEKMPYAFVFITPQQVDLLKSMSINEQQAYLKTIDEWTTNETQTKQELIYLVPDLHKHFKNLEAKFNRQLQRQVSGDRSFELDPPNELEYLDFETQLQVHFSTKILFPRKREAAIELLANCLVDLAYARYRSKIETQPDSIIPVKSKQTLLDITVESLAKIQGIKPKIAASLGSKVRRMGGLYPFLGQSSHISKLEQFGKGMWTENLAKFLNTDSSTELI